MSLRFEAEEGKEEENREKYEADYIAWAERAAKEIAATLKNLEVKKINEIVEFYEKSLEHPASMHMPLESEEKETIEKLVGKNRVKNTILTKTKALIFAPTLLAPSTFPLD